MRVAHARQDLKTLFIRRRKRAMLKFPPNLLTFLFNFPEFLRKSKLLDTSTFPKEFPET